MDKHTTRPGRRPAGVERQWHWNELVADTLIKRMVLVVGLLFAMFFVASPQAGATVYRGPGYTLYAPNMKGSPFAERIWLDPTSYHANLLMPFLPQVVNELRSWGFDLTYIGYAHGGAPSYAGGITVSSAVCLSGDSGYTNIDARTYPNGDSYIEHADVKICTTSYAGEFGVQNELIKVLRHEIGHAMGMGHYEPIYNGARQLMNPDVSTAAPNEIDYQTGDRNGLGYLATQSWGLRHGGQ
jgi:hypothetical protein